ncbi:MAG TPA: SDR family NAD(P)-dependent oxidoreductase [Phenylobacterium sp.]|uniref:SDR family NAD(P)-dependent oxidoreductase n=1 Tax=Phenylobacterium sp. TaxID=1871053 RepID=UPI002B6044DD|nr:SDR family NAD(P)-dependent oxidoreductase [Phenylobacterium sp.]HSV01886.1 SDR family NAD(P)-dependent oxidoreductase [Phenylobacterium sp.]
METAVVTGAGSGIGAAVAERFARGGAHVGVLDASEAGAQASAERLRAGGLSAEPLVCDVTDASAVEAAIGGLAERRGGVDAAVCAAGVASRHTIPQMDAAAWRRVIDVNLTGAFLSLKSVAAHASPAGASITIVSSVAAEHVAYLSGVHYASSKAGITGLVRHAAFELGRRNIRVNAVGPGPMSNRMGGGSVDAAQQQAAARNLPLQRVVEPADVAEVCWFLASPAARAVTGVYLPVDCGFLTSRGAAYQRYFEAHGEAF